MGQDTVIPMSGTEEQLFRNLSEHDWSATPTKPVWHRAIYPPRISLNGLLLAALFSVCIVLSGFIVWPVPNVLHAWLDTLPVQLEYTVQLPLMLLTAVILGPFMGPAAILLFLLIGLLWLPLFSGGGGWQYLMEPGFGYLLAALLVGSRMSRSFHKALQKTEKGSRSLRLCGKALGAALFVHAIGAAYATALAALGIFDRGDLAPWLLQMTVERLPYDMLACLLLFGLVRQIRMALWLILY
jgi:biotin transport system substrate-specific component